MTMHEDRQRRRNEALVVSLASGSSFAEAASAAGVSVSTVTRAMRRPAFRRAVQKVRDRVLDRIAGKIAQAGLMAVDTLLDAMASAESRTDKISAAKAVLDRMLKIREQHELASRIEALEDRQR